MPDGLIRLHRSGQAHFLTFSCYQRRSLLKQFHMEVTFLHALEQMRRRFAFVVFGYVLMPEHVHLLISELPGETLPQALQLLKTAVSIAARKQGWRKSGREPFWQARYFDHNVRNHAGFVTQLRYIHRNPVKRGLCATPGEWPWSSFHAWATGRAGIVEVESEMAVALRKRRSEESPIAEETALNSAARQ